MSLTIVGISDFPCPHCARALKAPANSAPLSPLSCPACLQLAHVPARIGDITLLGRLGHHPAGDVFDGREDLSGRPLNVLICHPPKGKLRPVVDATIEVYRRLSLASGRHLERIYRISRFDDHPVVVTESHSPNLCNLSRKQTIAKGEIRALASKMVSGMREARRAELGHWGLHPGDVLMRPDGLRLFGFSPWNFIDQPPGKHWKNLYLPDWAPPEVLAGSQPDLCSDVWSIGALMLYLATRKSPGIEEPPAHMLARLRPDLSAGFVDNVTRLMAPDPLDRPDSWRAVLELLTPGAPVNDDETRVLPGIRGTANAKPALASQIMDRIREEDTNSTLCGLGSSDLGLGDHNGYDQIRSLSTDAKGMMDMASDEFQDSEVSGPLDIMTRKVVAGEPNGAPGVDGGKGDDDQGLKSGTLPWVDEVIDLSDEAGHEPR